MANMTFGVNLLPKNDGNTYSLGNSNQKWKIYLSEINDTTFNGLGQAAEKNVDTLISDSSASTNLPTSAAVAAFVEGKGYITTDNNTTYTFTNGINGFTVTPSNGSAETITVTPNMVILSYGSSTWQDFLNAYNNNMVVYCRASSNSNPASGSQTRMAFMAYVNNATNPTKVEFQYYRSVSSHSASQQGDQVYVYVLDSSQGWSVITREAYSKIATGTGLKSSYSNSTITLSIDSLHLTQTGISSLPYTISNANIKNSMIVANYEINPEAVQKDLSVSTANGSLTISGTLRANQTLNVTLDLISV